MKTLKITLIGLGLIAITSCEKETKPDTFDGINDYKLITTKLIDNPPLGGESGCIWLWFETNDTATFETGMNGSNANEVITWSYPDSIPLSVFINTGAMTSSQPKEDKYNVKFYRNDTLVFEEEGYDLNEWYSVN